MSESTKTKEVSTERIRQLRNRYLSGFPAHAPGEVKETMHDLRCILEEVLEYREAEEQSGQQELMGEPSPEEHGVKIAHV